MEFQEWWDTNPGYHNEYDLAKQAWGQARTTSEKGIANDSAASCANNECDSNEDGYCLAAAGGVVNCDAYKKPCPSCRKTNEYVAPQATPKPQGE